MTCKAKLLINKDMDYEDMEVKQFKIMLHITDGLGITKTDEFDVIVKNQNEAPTVSSSEVYHVLCYACCIIRCTTKSLSSHHIVNTLLQNMFCACMEAFHWSLQLPKKELFLEAVCFLLTLYGHIALLN